MVTLSDTPLFSGAPQLIDALKERYAERHRRYHTWNHIEQMFAQFEKVESRLTDRNAVLYAICYHDAIFSVPSLTNEEESAELFASDANDRLDAGVIDRTKRLIIASKHHDTDETIPFAELNDCRYFLDVDMSILGGSPDAYQAYAENVREEYSVIPDMLYREGRKQFLQSLLEKPRIFLTDYFHDQLEIAARANIRNEIERVAP